MIAGPVLSPCSFHSSWSCAARQGHPASRDQLTDQEQCEAAKRITTRAKILSIDGPKTKRRKRSGFQGRQSGPHQYGGANLPQADTVRPPAQLGVYALQALTEQDVIAGQDVPYARLSRELITRASPVRVLACDIQRTLQNIHAHRQHCNVQPGANACWALASEMDMILTALRETQSATI